MNASVARVLPTVLSGALLFGAGVWWGGRSDSPRSASDPGSKPGGVVTLGRPATGAGSDTGGSADAALPSDLTAILRISDRDRRENDLLAIGARDFASGADWRRIAAGILDRVDRATYLQGYFVAWAKEKPRDAADELLNRSLSERGKLLPEIVTVWAETDPAAAEAWLVRMRGSEARDEALESLFRTWTASDPQQAVARSLRLPDESARFRALAASIREWSLNDLKGVRDWTTRIGDPNLKDFAMMAVADELSVRLPEEAMKWASDHLAADAEANPDIVNLVASKAGFETPRETFDWLRGLPASAETQASIAGVAAYLTEDNPEFATRDFPRLSADLQNATAAPIASTLGAQDPESGQRWLASLPQGETRRFATSAFAAGWATRDFAAAEAWVSRMPAGAEKAAAEEGLRNAFGVNGAQAVDADSGGGEGGSAGQ